MAISMTEAAAQHIRRSLNGRGKGEGIRLGVRTTGCSGLAYVLEFVDEVVLKYAPSEKFAGWVDSLRAVPDSAKAATQGMNEMALNGAFFELVDEGAQYTTKVLEMLPASGMVAKSEVIKANEGPGVKQQERALIADALKKFEGDMVDVSLLRAGVTDGLVPLTMAETPNYATFGLGAVMTQKGDAYTARTTIFSTSVRNAVCKSLPRSKIFRSSPSVYRRKWRTADCGVAERFAAECEG